MLRTAIDRLKQRLVAIAPRIFGAESGLLQKLSASALLKSRKESILTKEQEKCQKCQEIIDRCFAPPSPYNFKENFTHVLAPDIPKDPDQIKEKVIAQIFSDDLTKKSGYVGSIVQQTVAPKEEDEKLITKIETIEETKVMDDLSSIRESANSNVFGERLSRYTLSESINDEFDEIKKKIIDNNRLRESVNSSVFGERLSQYSVSRSVNDEFDEIAKECLYNKRNEYDNTLLREVERIGVPPISSECKQQSFDETYNNPIDSIMGDTLEERFKETGSFDVFVRDPTIFNEDKEKPLFQVHITPMHIFQVPLLHSNTPDTEPLQVRHHYPFSLEPRFKTLNIESDIKEPDANTFVEHEFGSTSEEKSIYSNTSRKFIDLATFSNATKSKEEEDLNLKEQFQENQTSTTENYSMSPNVETQEEPKPSTLNDNTLTSDEHLNDNHQNETTANSISLNMEPQEEANMKYGPVDQLTKNDSTVAKQNESYFEERPQEYQQNEATTNYYVSPNVETQDHKTTPETAEPLDLNDCTLTKEEESNAEKELQKYNLNEATASISPTIEPKEELNLTPETSEALNDSTLTKEKESPEEQSQNQYQSTIEATSESPNVERQESKITQKDAESLPLNDSTVKEEELNSEEKLQDQAQNEVRANYASPTIDTQDAIKAPETSEQLSLNDNTLTLKQILERIRQRSKMEYCKEALRVESTPASSSNPGNCPCNPPTPYCPGGKPQCLPPCEQPAPYCPSPKHPLCKPPCEMPAGPCPQKKCTKYEKADFKPFIKDLVMLLVQTEVMEETKPKMKKYLESILRNMDMCAFAIKSSDFMPLIVDDLEIIKGVLNARDYEPWTPIPSWPIPQSAKKQPLVCPQEGCKLIPPPKLNPPCLGNPCKDLPLPRTYHIPFSNEKIYNIGNF